MALCLELKIVGGLGNQLFQYAAGRSLSIKKNIPYLLLNSESYKNDPFGRKFGLSNFRVKGSVLQNEMLRKVFRKGTKINRVISGCPLYNIIEEDGLKLQPIADKTRFITSLSGYWQSDFYFSDIYNILLEELVPLDLPALPGLFNGKNTVAVHIRRSDYLGDRRFGALGEQYYHDAIELAKRKIDKPSFIFFSDDIGWCKEKFKGEGFSFCDDLAWERDYLQLYLMSKCAHQIIANSSFSWWGAWLNSDPGKIVIRPERPFADQSLMYESYYPKEWISINNL